MKSRRLSLLAITACLLLGVFPLQAETVAQQSGRRAGLEWLPGRVKQSPGTARLPAGGVVASASPRQDGHGIIEAKGRVQPAEFVALSSAQSGRIEAVLVQRGALVQRDQEVMRMEGSEQAAAQLAAAQVEVLLAEQALDELQRRWPVQRAEVELEIAQLQRQAALAQDRLDGLLAPADADRLGQARANLRLALHQLETAQNDLRKAQKRYDNQKSLIWYFINQRTVRLHLAQLEGAVALAQRRYDDAVEKLDKLQSPPDAVDVAVARAELQAAQSRLVDAQRRLSELRDGPRQDELELARQRLQSAQAAQLAAQEALDALTLKAPFDGVVVEVRVEAGEWLVAGQEAALLANFSAWEVQAMDVAEATAAGLQTGAPVIVRLDAYPEIELRGRIEQVDWISREEDGEVFYPLRVSILEAEPRLRWGLTARLEILP